MNTLGTLGILVLLAVASLITLTVVVLAEAGSLLGHVLAKRYRQLTITTPNGSRQASQTR